MAIESKLIRVRRGTAAEFEAGKSKIISGEFAVVTDTEEAYFSPQDGKSVRLATEKDVSQLEESIEDLKQNESGTGISTTAVALLMAFARSCYTSSNQDANLDALEKELLSSASGGSTGGDTGGGGDTEEVTLTSISAVANETMVAVGTLAKDLDITVTAHYSDGTSATITDYSISGTVGAGENTFTIVYGGKTTTVTVTGKVLAYSLYNKDMNEGDVDFGIELNELKSFTVKHDITMNSALSKQNVFAWKPRTADAIPIWLLIKGQTNGGATINFMYRNAENIGISGNYGYQSHAGDRHQFVATYDAENGTCEMYFAETPSGGTMVYKSNNATVDKSLYDGILGVTGSESSHELPIGDYTVNACEIHWEHTSESDAIAWFEREV